VRIRRAMPAWPLRRSNSRHSNSAGTEFVLDKMLTNHLDLAHTLKATQVHRVIQSSTAKAAAMGRANLNV
jgi:hypothetical protein